MLRTSTFLLHFDGMGSDHYTAAPIGGSLKLKGVKDAGVSKHKKKRKRPKPENESESETKAGEKSAGEGRATGVERTSEERAMEASAGEEKEVLEDDTPGQGKTEAERRHEEARRKRVCDHVPCQALWWISLTLAARRTPQARRAENAQRARRGTESLSEQSE